jgi:hypothetical protein
MNGSPLLLIAALFAAAAAAGCNDASSASSPSAPDSPGVEASAPSAEGRAGAVVDLPPPDSRGYIESSFDDVKLPMEKTDAWHESRLTDRVKALFGKKIRIRGYMFPTSRQQGLKRFVLVRDNLECCFGPGAALFDCILVSMNGDATAEYSIYPVTVEGEFRLEVLPGADGRPLAIYQMTGDAVE